MGTFGSLAAGWGSSAFEASDNGDLHVEFDAEMFGLSSGTRKKRVHAYRRHDGMWRISYRNKHAGGQGTSRAYMWLQDVKGHKFLLDLAGEGHTAITMHAPNKVFITVNDATSVALLKQLMTWSLR